MVHDDLGYPIGAVRVRSLHSRQDLSRRQHPREVLCLTTRARGRVIVYDASDRRWMEACLYEHVFGLFVVLVMLPLLLLGLLLTLPCLFVRASHRID